METRTVFLYGQSMLLALVARSLEGSPHLHVIHEETWEALKADVAECEPNVLIFDLTEACQSQVLPLLVSQPRLLLIGLDAERNHAVLLSGQETHSFTMNQIRTIVEGGEAENIPLEIHKTPNPSMPPGAVKT
jgi:hypothetical protein